MPVFEITTPDGKVYHAEGESADGALAAVKQMTSTGAATTRAASPVTDPALLAKLNAPDSTPIHIGAPDGSIVEFPAGTSDETINGAMRKAYPAPAAAAEPKSTLQTIREAIHAPTRLLENGFFLGLGDRARAGVGAIIGDGSYGDNLKKEQGETADFEAAHPIAAPVLEGVGSAAAPVGAIAAASKGVGLGAKMAYGAGAGAGIGGVQGALGSKDYTDLYQTGKDAGTGLVINGIIGGAIPAAGAIIGAGYRAAANLVRGRVDGMSRAAGGHLISAMEADGPAAVRARMQELGPDAMLTDAGPAFLGKAQGASLNSDEARSVLQGALTARDVGTNQRIQSDVNRALGPAEDPLTVSNAIKARRTQVDSVNYPAALDNAPAVKTAPIMRDLVDRIDQAPVGSMEHKALSSLQKMLTKTEREPMLDAGGYQVYDKLGNEKFMDVPYSHDDANVLHKVKGELDNVIEYDAPGLGVPAGALSRQQTALKQMRHSINEALETQVFGYAAANRQSAALARQGDAVQLGTQYLGSGKTTASPGRFADEFTKLQPAEQAAFATGSRGEIDRVLGTKANDLQALRGELQGEGGWNAAKLGTVHGQPAAGVLASSVDRNLAFRKSYSDVVQNSQTAQRQAAARAMKPEPSSETPLLNPNMSIAGLLATGAKKTANAALNAVRPDATRSYGEVAKVLTAQGPARDAHLQSIIDAIGNRQSNAAAAPGVGNIGAIVAAISGRTGFEKLHNDPRRNRN